MMICFLRLGGGSQLVGKPFVKWMTSWEAARQARRVHSTSNDIWLRDMGTEQRYVMEKLAVAQCKMERIMLGIILRDRKRNTWIRQETGVSDIINATRNAKHRWAGHTARLTWNPLDHQSNRVEPKRLDQKQVHQKHDGETISPNSLDSYGQD